MSTSSNNIIFEMRHKLILLLMLPLLLHLARGSNQCGTHSDEIAILDNELELLQAEVDKTQAIKFKFETESKHWQGKQMEYMAALKSEMRRAPELAKHVQMLETQIESEKEIVKQHESYNEELKIKVRAEEQVIQMLEDINSDLRQEIDHLKTEIQHKKQKDNARMKSPTWQRILLLAAKKGDLDEVESLLNKGVDKNVRDDSPERLTPLLVAAKNGHVKVVQLLLDKGASLEETSFSLNTALHEAASAGHLEVCNLLLERNAKLESYNTNNETPLQLAKKNGHQNVVDLFVKKSAPA